MSTIAPHPDRAVHRVDGRDVPLLFWRLAAPAMAISSGPLGGGLGVRHWVINATVPMSYNRDDPDVHLAALAADLGLRGPGIGLLTGVDVRRLVVAVDEGVTAWATVGLGLPTWAAVPAPAPAAAVPAPAATLPRVGTINMVVALPARLAPAALVNAVATVAEAKAQALREMGVPATGTPTDATCVLCPTGGPAEAYGGPRSRWGARIARAAHRAVHVGAGTPIRARSAPRPANR